MANPNLTEKLARWVAGGGRSIGEVQISQTEGGGYCLRHRADVGSDGLEAFESPAAARGVVRYDHSGEYRPLKSAPGLGRGWELCLHDAAELREALDYIYPASLGTWFADQESEIEAVPLREVLGRQTGMYRFANNLSDAGAQSLVAKECGAESGCLKRVCWPLAEGLPVESLPAEEVSREAGSDGEMPMLCVEACNWLVAKARKASAEEFEAAQKETD